MMTEEARKARAEYAKAWRKRNPEKSKAYCEKYWERVAEAIASSKEEQEQEPLHKGDGER